MKSKVRCLVILLALFVLCGCTKAPEKRSKTYYTYFDTVCTVSCYDCEDEEKFDSICLAVEERLDSLNRRLDIYHSYYGINNLYTLNENAGSFVELDSETVDFLKFCLEAKEFTNGYTDIEMGSVLSLWHEARTETKKVPSSEKLLEASIHCKDILEFDGVNVKITDSLASIDTGAVAKGWVADRIGDLLLSLGCEAFVVDIGGNIKCHGTYKIGIKDPSLTGAIKAKLELTDKSCVTSGDYERYFEADGKRYCHIINPYTLYPAENFTSVSVICENSAKADALSTALFCMSYEDGLELVEEMTDVDAFWIFKDGSTKHSENLSLI